MTKVYPTQIKLTAVEAQVLELIIKDYKTSEISERLKVTSNLVRAYKRNLLMKLDIHNVFHMENVSLSKNLFS